MHPSLFTLVIKQLDAQNFVLQDVYFMPLHVSSNMCSLSGDQIVLFILWFHHTETSVWFKINEITKFIKIVVILVILDHSLLSV